MELEWVNNFHKVLQKMGGNPGPVVIGGDSRSEGCVFESQHHIQDGHFHIYLL